MTQRWVFFDAVANETWTVPINPNSMTPVDRTKPRNLRHSHGWAKDQRVRTFVGKPPAIEWGFGGVIRTKAHYDELVRWTEKTNAITITDHIDRVFLVYLTQFDPTDRKPTPRVPWRLTYTVKATLLEMP